MAAIEETPSGTEVPESLSNLLYAAAHRLYQQLFSVDSMRLRTYGVTAEDVCFRSFEHSSSTLLPDSKGTFEVSCNQPLSWVSSTLYRQRWHLSRI